MLRGTVVIAGFGATVWLVVVAAVGLFVALSKRKGRMITPKMERELITSIQRYIWHEKRPPSSAIDALSRGFDEFPELPEDDVREFVDMDATLANRGWDFVGECSGPAALIYFYGPSNGGPDLHYAGLEAITSISFVLDRETPTNPCEVEVLLVGVPDGEGRLARIPDLTAQLDLVEAHRPGCRFWSSSLSPDRGITRAGRLFHRGKPADPPVRTPVTGCEIVAQGLGENGWFSLGSAKNLGDHRRASRTRFSLSRNAVVYHALLLFCSARRATWQTCRSTG
ncbi:hypothetical protein ACIBG0_39525 [Nocardia sp. NPDC050630]|uniref:hypothetical protein n=1 Tax=Nocardia sp. NPDC050630 TaxID=3364321 RepID=UPI00379B8C37